MQWLKFEDYIWNVEPILQKVVYASRTKLTMMHDRFTTYCNLASYAEIRSCVYDLSDGLC